MGLFKSDPKRAAAKGGVPENPAYWKANDRVIAAEKNVRWYER